MDAREQELRLELERMGEPPSSVDYLTRTVYWNGEAVDVREPSRNFPATDTGD